METDAFHKHKKIEIIQLQDVESKERPEQRCVNENDMQVADFEARVDWRPPKIQTRNRGIALKRRTEKSARSTYPLAKSRKR